MIKNHVRIPNLLNLILLIFSITGCNVDQAALKKAAGEAGLLGLGSLTIASGNNQSTLQNTLATQSLEVLALDSEGNAKSGVSIKFQIVTENGGSLDDQGTSKTVSSGVDGKASVTYRSASSLGEVIILATSSAGNVSFTQIVTDSSSSSSGASGSSLLIVKGNNQTVEENAVAAEDLEVLALNSLGAPLENTDITFAIYTTLGGTLSSSALTSKVVTTSSAGKASVSFNALARMGATTVIATSSAGNTAFNINVVATGSATTTPLGSTLLMLKGNNLVIEQNTTTSLEVLALNSAGIPMANTDITFEVLTSGTISNPQPTLGTDTGTGLTAKTGSNGRASVTYTAPSSLGTATIIARSGAGSVAFNLSVGITGIGSILSISRGNGQVIVPNTLASQDLEVIATSASGSPLAGITVTFTVTTTNGGVLSNSQGILVGTTDASGKASTTFTSSNTSGPISVLASSSVGSVTFALNTSTSGSGGSSGTISFNPATYSPASGSWLNANVGAEPSKSVTVTNTASYGLYINSIFTTTSTPFTIVSDTCPRSPTPLATTESCTVVISFSPTSSSSFSKFLFLNWSTLNDGSNGQNSVLALEGSGPVALTFVGISSVDNVTSTSLRLNWAAASGGAISQYRVYRMISGVPSLIATLASSTLTYSISDLMPSTSYTYRVRAVNTANEEDGNTADVSATTQSLSLPVIVMDGAYDGDFIFPSNPKLAGSPISINFKNSSTGNDTGASGSSLAYSCKFSRSATGLSSAKSNCTQSALGGSFSLNSSSGQFDWTPTFGTQGVFEFLITGTDSNGPGLRYFTINVAHPYAAVNLSTILADYRATFANMAGANSGSADFWKDITGLGNHSNISGSPMWAGVVSNTVADPQRFSFTGNTELNLGTILSGYNRFMLDFWISNPETMTYNSQLNYTFANNSILMKMDDDTTDNGFKITQTTLHDGKRGLRLDFERSYGKVILNDLPVAYWRMDESTGTTINDEITTNDLRLLDVDLNPSSYGFGLGQVGATKGEQASTAISTHTNRMALPNVSALKPVTDFSVEMWVKYANKTIPADHTLYTLNTTGTANGFSILMVNGILNVKYKPASSATVTLIPTTYAGWGHLFDLNWHHIVFTSTNTYKALFVDGTAIATSNLMDGAVSWPSNPDAAWVINGADQSNPATVDEVALYNFAISLNQIKGHLAAADHFVRNQALYPANANMQSRPLAYWRFGDPSAYVSQDFSGNQQDMIQTSGYNYKTTGVYTRPGGSGLDSDGASYNVNQDGYVIYSTNPRIMAFNNKLTYSAWINFTSYMPTNWYIPLFASNKWSGNNYGILFRVHHTGKLVVDFDRAWTTSNNYTLSTDSVLPGSANTNLPLGWYHIAMTYDGDQAIAKDRVQFYVNGASVKMDTPVGVIPTSLSSLTGPGWDFQVSTARSAGGQVLGGSAQRNFANDENVFYNRLLPAQEIRAQAHEGSLRYCDIEVLSQAIDPANSKPFDFINMLYDGTTITVKRNSKLECALRPQINLSLETLDLKLGATTNGFKGHITDLRVHGADNATVATITNAHTAFLQSSDQHRPIPMGNIVKTDLVRAYEAATALDGVRPHSPGCSDAQAYWRDTGHSTTGMRQEYGYLKNFTGCANNGWNGTGIPTDPYRLTFDGTDDWVDLGNSPIYPVTQNKLSVCAWTRTTQSADTTILSKGGGWGDFNLGSYSGGLWLYLRGTYTGSSGASYGVFRNGNWHYVCGAYNGANYFVTIDGSYVVGPIALTGALGSPTSTELRMTLGRIVNWSGSGGNGTFYSGDIGAVHIYNAGLTLSEIKQNCSAQAANYNMSTCAP